MNNLSRYGIPNTNPCKDYVDRLEPGSRYTPPRKIPPPRFSVATLFRFVARFARVGILNSRPDGLHEVLVSVYLFFVIFLFCGQFSCGHISCGKFFLVIFFFFFFCGEVFLGYITIELAIYRCLENRFLVVPVI